MKKTTEQYFCDICGAECEIVTNITYPVIFHTEQTEGRNCNPYISYQKIDVCDNCGKKILKISAVGAQGYNEYSIIKGGE